MNGRCRGHGTATARTAGWSLPDAAVALLFIAIAVTLYFPLLGQFSAVIPGDPGDPLLNTWILWWNAQHLPSSAEYWHAPAFAPSPNALALSETLFGLTWFTTPLQWLGTSPLAAYNALFLLTPVLNGVASYALCRHLTGRRDAALVGSMYFAMAPYRAVQISHLQTQAVFFMPIALLALHRYWRTSDRRWLLALTISVFLNGCISGYHLLYLAVAIGLVCVWLAASAPDWRKALAVAGALAAALLVMMPMLLVYARVHAAWGLQRGLEEMALFSADLGSFTSGDSSLLLWRLSPLIVKPEADVYPGIVMLTLLGIGLAVARRGRFATPSAPRPIRILRVALLMTAVVTGAAAGTALGLGPMVLTAGPLDLSITRIDKPLGVALSALLVTAALSPRLWRLARTGSVAGLYGTLFVLATILMLGPEGELLGERFWYKAPFAWLVELPGFNTVRVPARLANIQILAASVLCAIVATMLTSGRGWRAMAASGALCGAILLDGWFTPRFVATPAPLGVELRGDLVLEVPTRGWTEDVAAMYRGIWHGRAVVNGYSGYLAPHYPLLIADIAAGCVESLDALRRGRSLDVVVWRADAEAPAVASAIASHWPSLVPEVNDVVIVFRIPADRHPAESSHDDVIDLGSFCHATRAAAVPPP